MAWTVLRFKGGGLSKKENGGTFEGGGDPSGHYVSSRPILTLLLCKAQTFLLSSFHATVIHLFNKLKQGEANLNSYFSPVCPLLSDDMWVLTH